MSEVELKKIKDILLDLAERTESKCGFCGKRRSQVKILLHGGFSSICNECVGACCQKVAELILQEEEKKDATT